MMQDIGTWAIGPLRFGYGKQGITISHEGHSFEEHIGLRMSNEAVAQTLRDAADWLETVPDMHEHEHCHA